MKKIILNILKTYDFTLVAVLVVVGLKRVTRADQMLVPILFLPVFFYLVSSFSKIKNRVKIPLLIYSLVFSIILVVAELLNLRIAREGIFLGLMVPLPILFAIEIGQMLGSLKQKPVTKLEVISEETTESVDKSKRKFLKIAAGTSLATAVMFFLNKQKAGAAFFGSVPGPGTVAIKDTSGNKVDIAQKQPLDGDPLSDLDTAGATQYFGFVNKDGAWYILQVNSDNSIRYAKGPSTYSWSARASQSYGVFSDVF